MIEYENDIWACRLVKVEGTSSQSSVYILTLLRWCCGEVSSPVPVGVVLWCSVSRCGTKWAQGYKIVARVRQQKSDAQQRLLLYLVFGYNQEAVTIMNTLLEQSRTLTLQQAIHDHTDLQTAATKIVVSKAQTKPR